MFERGQLVMVRLRARDEPVEAQVVLDVGDATVVVDPYGDPARFRRVPRRAVTNGAPQKAPAVRKPAVVRERKLSEVTALSCMETEHGWCATQIQARKLTKAEVIDGVWTLCHTWAESRTLPLTREPSCPRCRERLEMEPT